MAEGFYYSGGAKRHNIEGSLQEIKTEFPAKGFEEKVAELRTNGAAEFVRQRKFGKLIEKLLETHELDELTAAVCEQFLYQNPEFSDYNPALVKVAAELIVAEREAQAAIDSVKH